MLRSFVPATLMAIAMAPLTSLSVSDDQMTEAFTDLATFVAIPSVSQDTSPYYSPDTLNKAVDFVKSNLLDLGFTVNMVSLDGVVPQYVLGELKVDESKPTFLLYGHYDVQPVDETHWDTPPFTLTEKNGRLYGRGASDDKAGIIAILTALRAYHDAGLDFPVNLKVLFEGEEEVGSPHMGDLLDAATESLRADGLIVMDGMNRGLNFGSLTSATRGIVKFDLEVTALAKPVHSGIGCLVPDPAQGLAQLIYALRDPTAIPGFMEDYIPLTDQERQLLGASSQSAEVYATEMGVLEGLQLRGDANESIDERIVAQPSLSIVNMTCGKPHGGNSIQNKARCEIGIRVTPGQDPERIAKVVMDYVKAQPIMLDMDVSIIHPEKGSWAWKADLSKPFLQMYHDALENNFSNANYMPMGGALPFLTKFQEVFPNMDLIIPGVEDPYTSAHSHNESQDVTVFRNAVNSLIEFLDQAGQ